MSITARRLTGALGAEVSGVDICSPLSAGEVDAVRALLLEHEVLVFRDAPVTPEQHIAFAGRFGEIKQPPVRTKHTPWPEINVVDQTSALGQGSDDWHNDNTYTAEPPFGSILHLVRRPSAGGDTAFASMGAAYDALAAPFRRMLDELVAVHDVTKSATKGVQYGHLSTSVAELQAMHPPVEHPVVRRIPETGRKVLFVNPNSTTRIVGMSEAESDAILRFLYEHVKRLEFQCRVAWDESTVVFLDNRTSQHYAVPDYNERRILHRVAIKGDRPVGVA
jgi:taurine dioxygenase